MADDLLLVGEAINGSEDAYAQLYASLRPRAANVAFRILRQTGEAAEDFIHDVTTHVLMRLDRFAGESKFSTWATSVMQNQALMLLRKQRAPKRSAAMVYLDAETEEGSAPFEVSDGRDIEAEVIARCDVPKLLRGMSFPQEFQDQILDGMTGEELAAKYRVSVPAMKARLQRARKQGRMAMEGQTQEVTGIGSTGRTCKCGCGATIGARGWPYAKGHSPERERSAPRASLKPPAGSVSVTVSEEVVDALWARVPPDRRTTILSALWREIPLAKRAQMLLSGIVG